MIAFLAVLMVASLSACGETASSSSEATSSVPASTKDLELYIGAGSVGGAYYTMSAGLATILTREVDGIRVSAQASAGSGENFVGLYSGEFNIGLGSTDFAYIGSRGGDTENASYVDYPDVKAIMMFEIMPHFMIKKAGDTRYMTYSDIAKQGTRVACGVPGSGSYAFTQNMLKPLGLSLQNMTTMPGGHSQMAESLKDGNADVLVNIIAGLSSPGSAIAELSNTADIEFVPIEQSILDEVNNAYPYQVHCNIKAGWVKQLTEDYPTLGISTTLMCRADLPDEVVYNICKTIFENIDELSMSHSSFAELTKENAAVDLPCALHPGAQKYFEENGFTITYLD